MRNVVDEFMEVSVVGLGYIGLPTALAFASAGKKVNGYDVSARRVSEINSGACPIAEEEGAEQTLRNVLDLGLLKASSKLIPAPVYVIAVPTPVISGTNVPDLSIVENAVSNIAPVLKKGDLIILESTSPVGTTERIGRRVKELRPDLDVFGSESSVPDVFVAYCPERVLPGRIMEEIVNNDRIVGGLNSFSANAARRVYETFCRGSVSEASSASVAEIVKLVENSFRDVNIAFANELSILSSKLKLDVKEVIDLANHHPRVDILKPGIGVGGHCIAVDPYFLISGNEEVCHLISTAREVDYRKQRWVVSELEATIKELFKFKSQVRVALLGMAFKPNVADVRNSPAINIICSLSESISSIEIFVHDAHYIGLPQQLIGRRISSISSLSELESFDLVVKLVDHDEYSDVESSNLPFVDFT